MSINPPSDVPPQNITSSQDDPEGDTLYNWISYYAYNSNPYSADLPLKALALAMKTEIDSLLPPGPIVVFDHNIIEQAMANILSGATGNPPCDAFMQYNLDPAMLDTFETQMNSVMSNWGDSWQFPSIQTTGNDQTFLTIFDWTQNNKNSGVVPLADAILNWIKADFGSQGDGLTTALPGYLNSIFSDSNFFTNYPSITPGVFPDLQNFFGSCLSYTLPDFTQNYLETYYSWPNPNDNSADAALQEHLLNEMRTNWGEGAIYLSALQAEANGIIDGGFAGLDLQGAQNLEASLGLQAPGLQSQFFATRDWIAGLPSGTPLYNMVESLMQAITSNWPAGDISDLQTWYSTNYALPNVLHQDIFMQYPAVTTADIQNFYGIANGPKAPPLVETQMDINYRSALAYLNNTPGLSPADQTLMNALVQQYLKYGSSDTGLSTVLKWAEGIVGTTMYSNATPGTQQQFTGYFGYALTLTTFGLYLIQWGGSGEPAYKQHFAVEMRAIIAAYMIITPNPTQAGFQDFLNQNQSNIDFCFEFPGLDPFDVALVFAQFNLTNPYNYTVIDMVYAANNRAAQQENPPAGSADALAFDALNQQLIDAKNTYSTNPGKAYLLLQQWIANYPQAGLQQATLDAFMTVFNTLPPS